jgi:hypothetical protein
MTQTLYAHMNKKKERKKKKKQAAELVPNRGLALAPGLHCVIDVGEMFILLKKTTIS